MKKVVLLLSLMAMVLACDKEVEELKAVNLDTKTAELIEADNAFGLNLLSLLNYAAAPEENLMISPLSISLALTMTYNGAEGDTKSGMADAMERSGLSRETANQLNKKLVNALREHDPNVVLEIANSVWYRNDFTIRQSFIDTNSEYYDARVSALDFSDPETKNTINQWVAEKTHDKIDKIVDQISPESFMFLINAIYFNGNWKYQFDKKNTYDGSFYINDAEFVEVPMMSAELNVNMLRTDQFDAVELPYGKGNWSMFVFLPHGENTVDEMIRDLDAPQWNKWMNDFSPAKGVDVKLPRFSFAYEESLKDVLITMGMDHAFSSMADFSGILEGGGISISDVKHKTFIEVNEEGTEAAAVTSVEIELTSVGNYFIANRPFLFVIAEKSSNTILFIGKYVNPGEN